MKTEKLTKETYEMYKEFKKITLYDFLESYLVRMINEDKLQFIESTYGGGEYEVIFTYINEKDIMKDLNITFGLIDNEWNLIKSNVDNQLTIGKLELSYASFNKGINVIDSLGLTFTNGEYKNIKSKHLFNLIRSIEGYASLVTDANNINVIENVLTIVNDNI